MGTRLIARGLDLATDDPASGSSTVPRTSSRSIGSTFMPVPDALFTDTFGANRIWLDRFGRAGMAKLINRRARRTRRGSPPAPIGS